MLSNSTRRRLGVLRGAGLVLVVTALGASTACGGRQGAQAPSSGPISCPRGATLNRDDLEGMTRYWCERVGTRHGPFCEVRPDGQMARLEEYDEGVAVGTVTEWYPSGQKWSEYQVVDGEPSGIFHSWELDGTARPPQEVKAKDAGEWYPESQESLEHYLSEERDSVQKSGEVLQALGLKPGDVIADVGAGSGYFTWKFSKEVGPSGRVLAVDPCSNAMAFMRGRLESEPPPFPNIELVLSQLDDVNVRAGTLDWASCARRTSSWREGPNRSGV